MRTSISIFLALFVFILTLSYNLWAAPAGAPDSATALCKDDSYYSGANKRGACSRHGGVKEWFGAANTVDRSQSVQTVPAPIPSGPMNRDATAPPSRNNRTAKAPSSGGMGQVWVNTESKVYHCPGTRWYGATKLGEYMSEVDAKAQGNRADHNKNCNQ